MFALARLGLVLALWGLCAVPPARAQEARALPAIEGREDILRWMQFVLPSAEEETWRAIGWRAQLHEALIAAKAEDRPVLLWAMNGHPLGCV